MFRSCWTAVIDSGGMRFPNSFGRELRLYVASAFPASVLHQFTVACLQLLKHARLNSGKVCEQQRISAWCLASGSHSCFEQVVYETGSAETLSVAQRACRGVAYVIPSIALDAMFGPPV